jgi:hypothetical protein
MRVLTPWARVTAICSRSEKHRYLPEIGDSSIGGMPQFTSVLFVAFKNDFSSEFHQGGSIYPAIQNFYLAARPGIGERASPVGLPTAGSRSCATRSAFPTNRRWPGMLSWAGRADTHRPVRRRPLTDVVFHNHWDPDRADITYGRGARPQGK